MIYLLISLSIGLPDSTSISSKHINKQSSSSCAITQRRTRYTTKRIPGVASITHRHLIDITFFAKKNKKGKGETYRKKNHNSNDRTRDSTRQTLSSLTLFLSDKPTMPRANSGFLIDTSELKLPRADIWQATDAQIAGALMDAPGTTYSKDDRYKIAISEFALNLAVQLHESIETRNPALRGLTEEAIALSMAPIIEKGIKIYGSEGFFAFLTTPRLHDTSIKLLLALLNYDVFADEADEVIIDSSEGEEADENAAMN